MSESDKRNKLRKLFEIEYGGCPKIIKIGEGGSIREYYRLTYKDLSVVGVVCEDIKENQIFIRLDLRLKELGVKVPGIIVVSDDWKAYLLQDLGDELLYPLLKGDDKMKLSESALKDLITIQSLPEEKWIDYIGYPPFSRRLVSWDLNYFKYDFLKPSGILFDEEKLEDDFDKLVEELTSASITTGFMYRDFQSRNIMLKDDKLWFIDFQGARKGPVAYDAVSFIWQAKAPFTFSEREALEDFYIKEASKILNVSIDSLKAQMNIMKIFRTLQVLGAYGFRGLIERKPHFLESIPYGLRNLEYLSQKGYLKSYPEIESIAQNIVNKNQLNQDETTKLTLSVFSFSYKKGYPVDESGNGGGFIFDCRAIHNPGRYDEYKTKTGRDKEVIEFLEKTDEAEKFIKNAVDIITPSIERYLKRGFTSLQIGFGCTGGQHRSVYCAEHFSRLISRMYPEIIVKVNHREQEISYIL